MMALPSQKNAPAAPAGSGPVTLPAAEQRAVFSRAGREYRIMIARPLNGAPSDAGGYPVLYALDANACFATLAPMVWSRSQLADRATIAPAIVVGIGYPTELPLDMVRRTYDYTPPADVLRLSPRPDGTPWPKTGGADEFLDFLAAELMPSIALEFSANPERQALFGHSFGGLFALHALFTRPALFRHIIAASPSVWWNERFILQAERAFSDRLRSSPIDADVLVTVGSLEQQLTPFEEAAPDRDLRAQWKRQNRMLDNARELSGRLASLDRFGLRMTYTEFEGEDHGTVVPAALSRAVSFALGKKVNR